MRLNGFANGCEILEVIAVGWRMKGNGGWGGGGSAERKRSTSGFKEKNWQCEKMAKPSWFGSENEVSLCSESPSSSRTKRSNPPRFPLSQLREAFPQTTAKVAFELCYILHTSRSEGGNDARKFSELLLQSISLCWLFESDTCGNAGTGKRPEMWVRI